MDTIVTVDGTHGTIATDSGYLRRATSDARSRATDWFGTQHSPEANTTDRRLSNKPATRQHR